MLLVKAIGIHLLLGGSYGRYRIVIKIGILPTKLGGSCKRPLLLSESRIQGCFQSHLGIFIPVGLCLDVSVSSWRPALHTRSGGEGCSGEEGMAGFSQRRLRESLPLCLSFPCPCGRLPSETGSAFPPLLGAGPVTCSDPKDEVGQSASH